MKQGKKVDPAEIRIVFTSCTGNVEHFAAKELRSGIARMTGVAVPVSTGKTDGGVSIELETLNGKDTELRFDGSAHRVGEPDHIAANLPRGVLNGVYELLEFWGCRWFFYQEQPVFPHREHLSMPESRTVNPDLERGESAFFRSTRNTGRICAGSSAGSGGTVSTC